MSRHLYRFRDEWWLDAAPEAVYDALERLPEYPRWWREVRAAERVAEDVVAVRCRATLPYVLRFTITGERRDRSAGLLHARLRGDLDGYCHWTIRPGPDGRGTVAGFDQEVLATRTLLRALAPVARPVFEANHALMMRHGRKGLRAHLAAG